MKKHLLTVLLATFAFLGSKATVYTINNSGFSFVPPNITIIDGDSVRFVIGNSHDAREVSQATYQSNGSTALSGGFQTAFGGGLVLPTKLTPGIHYYVCTPHAGFGMKGTIEVIGSTGVSEQESVSEMVVFPNPANELLNIELPDKFAGTEYTIMDVYGKSVLKGVLTGGRQAIPVDMLPAGYYVIMPGCSDRKPIEFIKQ